MILSETFHPDYTTLGTVTLLPNSTEVGTRSMRKASIVIYLTHMVFISLYNLFIMHRSDGGNGIDVFLAGAVASILLSSLVILCERTRAKKFLSILF